MKHPPREPRTSREALVAELLGDIDGLLKRAEAMTDRMERLEARLAVATQALDEAGTRYGRVVNAFIAESKNELTAYLQRRAAEVASSHALAPGRPSAARGTPVDLDFPSRDARGAVGHRRGSSSLGQVVTRVLEHGVTAVLASMLTATLVLLVTR